jgi:hypothetical protein
MINKLDGKYKLNMVLVTFLASSILTIETKRLFSEINQAKIML